MSAGAAGILRALLTHAKVLGVFDAARIVEPKVAPPPKLCFWVWTNTLGAAGSGSGLASTAADFQVFARITHPAISKPEDAAELAIVGAADSYLGRLCGDLTLGGLVRNIDVLGEQNEPIIWRFGYLTVGDTQYRIADLTVPCLINDAWTQAE